MQLLKATSIKYKNDLVALYIDQFSKSTILDEIREIQVKTKKKYKGKNVKYAQLVSLREVLIYINTNGAPIGYQLNEEMEFRLKEYKADLFAAKCLRFDRSKAALKEEVNKNLEKLKKDDKDKLV